MEVYERIIELRRALNLTQSVFAEKICISKGYLVNIETGTKCVNDRIIRLIGTTFGASEQWLLSGEGAMFHNTENHKISEIVRMFKDLNPFFQDYFLNQLKQIYEYEKKTRQTAIHH
ncbi:MAG: helix-turn-helix domain-containing protein [Spirochaetaceae bacterium]|nr:helix-turn-helix domain-containing protein [Spirochaetaceae bacterium]